MCVSNDHACPSRCHPGEQGINGGGGHLCGRSARVLAEVCPGAAQDIFLEVVVAELAAVPDQTSVQ